jgi:AcrR family transcriptional regulator
MLGTTNTDRRSARHQATKAEILDAAWELVRENGLAGLSLRDLGAKAGMKAQSLYSYFASKNEIYDAMFRQGYEAFIEETAGELPEKLPADITPLVLARALTFFDFCTSDPVRYQLLFQRTIPDFVPSPDSYAVATRAYAQLGAELAHVGITDPAALDLWTAVLTGLTDQQISNDPGGHRWRDLVGRTVAMLLAELDPQHAPSTATRAATKPTTPTAPTAPGTSAAPPTAAPPPRSRT